MSRYFRAAAILVFSLALAACTSSGSGKLGDASTLSQAPQDDASGETACDEVAAGIEAFNAGDLDETVASFERAIPLAESEDSVTNSRASADLLEAVRYYADLAPQDYPAAARSSRDFARYKAITLGQCLSGRPPAPDDGGGIAA